MEVNFHVKIDKKIRYESMLLKRVMTCPSDKLIHDAWCIDNMYVAILQQPNHSKITQSPQLV